MAALHDWKVAAALLFGCTLAIADDAPRPPGYRIGDAAAPTEYTIRLAIDPAQPTFAGEARVAFQVKAQTPIVWMHARRLVIESVEITQGGNKLDVELVPSGEEYLGLRAKGTPFAAGEATAVFRYTGMVDLRSERGLFRQVEAGEIYIVSQHEDTEARNTFPCFDEPGFKVPWTLTIDAPAGNVVVSNTPETSVSDVPGRAGWRRHAFARTKPLPSYLVALAVGPFEVVDGGTAGMNKTPLRYLAPKGRAADVRYAKEVTPRILELLEEYFGMPYPYEKLDHVTMPGNYQFGAMENVGLITYSQRLILATPAQETERYRRAWVSVSAHEMAHMWFGDLVTLAWWDDVWLNEAFATWMARKVMFRFNPQWDTGEERAGSRGFAIGTDRLASARRVHNPVNSKEDLEGAFDAISYQKGAAVLEMFEAWIGRSEFRTGVREYLKQHANGSATSADFFAAIAAASGRGPETLAAFQAFVEQSGVPLLDVELVCGKAPPALQVAQQRLRPKGSTAEGRQWTTPACFATGDGRSQCESITNPERSIPLTSATACPAWVLGNAGGTGHYVVRYGPNLWKRLLKSATSLPAHEAAAFLGDTRVLAESGLVPVEAAFELADLALAHRSPVVELMAVRILSKTPDAWLNPAQLKKKNAVIAQRVQPLARRVGWKEKPGDAYDMTALRFELLPFAARSEGGAALRNEARRLAVSWMRDRASVPAAMAPAVLETAARFADRATYELLVSLAATTKDGRERQWLLKALATVRDPELRARAFGLMVKQEAGTEVMNGRDMNSFMREAMEDDINRVPAFDFVRTNFDAIVAKFPRSSLRSPGNIPAYLHGLCKPADRDTFVTFFKDRAPQYERGRRSYDEALEAIELCIAARA